MTHVKTQLSFADYAGIVWQRRRTALLAAGLFACIVFIAFNCLPRQYTSTAIFERHGDVVSAQTEQYLPASFSTLKPMLSFELIGTQAVLTALEQVGCAERMPRDAGGHLTTDAEAALTRTAEKISADLHLKWLVNSANLDTISVSLTSGDPVLTGSLANQLVNNYIARTRSTLLNQLTESTVFLDERLATAQDRLGEVRAKLRDFSAAHPNMTPANPQKLSDQMRELDVQLDDLQQQRADWELRLNLLAEQAQGADSHTSPEYQEIAKRLSQYQEALADAQNVHGMTERHPRVLKLQQSIEQARKQLADLDASHSAAAPSPAAAAALEDVQASLRRVDTLASRKRQQREELAKAQDNALPAINEYERINGQIQETENEIALWQRGRATVQMALEAERNGTRTHFKLIHPAAAVFKPTWPALWHVFFIALVGGACVGVAAAIALSRLSRSFSTPAEAATALALPLLGVIGPILSPASRRLASLRRYVLVPATVTLVLLVMTVSAASIVLATHYPGQYVQLRQQFIPTAWSGLRQMLGAG
jgi:uncharacterized protein involved in exopolysaccharide biosynthesis